MTKAQEIIEMLNEGAPPKMICDKVNKLRKEGKTDEEISKMMGINLSTIQNIE